MLSVTSAARSNSSIDLLPLVALGSSVNYVHLTGFDIISSLSDLDGLTPLIIKCYELETVKHCA